MSLIYSLSNAMSGLNATSRAAEVVSNNVANAMTEGYARRELELSARATGGRGAGVNVDGVSRIVDEALLRDRRLSDASVGNASITAEFYGALERLIGTPEDPGSLGKLVSGLESSLIEAASRPDSIARLQAVADSATALVGKLNVTSNGIQKLRIDAEDQIAVEVDALNASLRLVADLNTQIVAAHASKRDASALLDLRQQEVDRIASIVPLREVPRHNGAIALFSTQGARLIDGQVAPFGFTPSGLVTPHMTEANGQLDGITIDGKAERTDGPTSPIAGGSLGALFELRDTLAVAAQTRIDAVARDLAERFAGAGLPLFTDDLGTAFAAANEEGFAGRIGVTAAVLPEQGGELWRLRDGLAAGAPGDVGNGSRLQLLADALSARRDPASGGLPTNRSASGVASFVLSDVGTSRHNAERVLTGASSQQATLRAMQLADGVDTDAEMQRLMMIEQAYAANARVISVVDEMMQIILGL